MCVCVCVCARARVCVCARARACVVCVNARAYVHSFTQVERRETTNVTFAHSFEHMQHDVKMLTLMLLRLGILAGEVIRESQRLRQGTYIE
jgi:hypothetical protein